MRCLRFLPLLLVPMVLPGSPVLLAQSAPIQVVVATAPAKYAGESVVLDHAMARFVMQADGTGYREREVTVRVQSEAALKELSVVAVDFAGASEKVEYLYVRVRRPDGTVVETPPADVQEQSAAVTREAPFYSDLKEKQLPVKSLRVGDTLEYKVRTTRSKAEAVGQFWGQETFSRDVVSLDEVLELQVPKGKAVTVWTNSKLKLTPVESDEGATHLYRWQYRQTMPTAGPAAEAARETKKKTMLTPEEDKDQREGLLPSVAWTTFKDWAAVGAWYRGLESGRVAPDATVKAKVAELTAGKATTEEKVRAVYGFVAPQIRYIGVALGIGRYQPHHAEEILENQYGDCKDKHTLLASMLEVLGLKPEAVLIGQEIRFNEAVPSPGAFNHLISKVAVEGKPVWLDATAEVAPYRVLNFELRDKQALVIPEEGEARIERTPPDLPFASMQTWAAKGEIDKAGTSNSRITLSLRGDVELLYRTVMRQIAPAQYSEVAQRMASSMGYGGTTSHPEFGKPEDTVGPYVFSFDYKREHKPEDWATPRFVAQLAPVGLTLVDEKQPPVASIDLGVPRTEESTAEMKLPAGWTAELPEAVHQKTAYATYDETYRFENGTVYAQRKVVILQRLLPAAEWKGYKKFADSISLSGEWYIDLVRPRGEKAEGPEPVPGVKPSNADAAKLVTRADKMLRDKDLVGAGQMLDQAEALNNTQKGLWGAKGALAYHRGEMTEAIRDYSKEVAMHPEATWVYAPMAHLQTVSGHPADAEATLRSWLAAEPASIKAAVALMTVLLAEGKAAEAAQAGKRTLEKIPEGDAGRSDTGLLLLYGKAQLQAGQGAGGAATLRALLKDSDDPSLQNDAAYELADGGQELPLAESTVRAALEKLGAETRTWTLDESAATMLQKSSTLAASWDTLGWVLFREGKLTQAEDYIGASWKARQSAVVGEHLGDVQSARGEHAAAALSYTLTMATLPKYNELGVRVSGETAESKRLKGKIAEQKKAGAKIPGDGPEGLVRVRTVSLGPAAGKQGFAEYLLLLEQGHLVRARATGEKTVAGGDEMFRHAAFPGMFPEGSDARLVRRAMLNCHSNVCEVLFE